MKIGIDFFDDFNDYKLEVNNIPKSLELNNAKLAEIMTILPIRDGKKVIGSTPNSTMVPLINLHNVLNEKDGFTDVNISQLESSFKGTISFYVGMIMTVLVGEEENWGDYYHLKAKGLNIVKNNIDSKSIPDFLFIKEINGKLFGTLVDAKGTSSTFRKKDSVEKGLVQLKQIKAVEIDGTLVDLNKAGYVVASSFKDTNNKLHVDVIDPRRSGDGTLKLRGRELILAKYRQILEIFTINESRIEIRNEVAEVRLSIGTHRYRITVKNALLKFLRKLEANDDMNVSFMDLNKILAENVNAKGTKVMRGVTIQAID